MPASQYEGCRHERRRTLRRAAAAGRRVRHGEYELVFAAGDYLRRQGASLPDPAFLDIIPIRFGMAEARHYHVPLLVSPYGYSTYRGS